MLGISIDNNPDSPVGTPDTRRTVAIHWNWTTEYTTEEIASALGVTERTVQKYISEGPTEGVKEQMEGVESEVRMIAVAELKEQLRVAGHRSRTAEKPVEVWTDGDGDLRVRDVRDDTGDLVERVPIPNDFEFGANEEARYYARAEVREIIDDLTDLTGVGEPKQIEHGGDVDVTVTSDVVEITEDDLQTE